jgi:hypothetical protein
MLPSNTIREGLHSKILTYPEKRYRDFRQIFNFEYDNDLKREALIFKHGKNRHCYLHPRVFSINSNSTEIPPSRLDHAKNESKITFVVITGLPRNITSSLRINLDVFASETSCRLKFLIFLSGSKDDALIQVIQQIFTEYHFEYILEFIPQQTTEIDENFFYNVNSPQVRHSPSRVRRMFLGLEYASKHIATFYSDYLLRSIVLRIRTDTIVTKNGFFKLLRLLYLDHSIFLSPHPGNGLVEISDMFLLTPAKIFTEIFAGNTFSNLNRYRQYASKYFYNPEFLFTSLLNYSISCQDRSVNRVFCFYFGLDIILMRDTIEEALESNLGIYLLSALTPHKIIEIRTSGAYGVKCISPREFPFSTLLLQRTVTHLGEISSGVAEAFFPAKEVTENPWLRTSQKNIQ